MIARHLSKTLKAAARDYPVVTVTGPRQSGKTTLGRAAFPRQPRGPGLRRRRFLPTPGRLGPLLGGLGLVIAGDGWRGRGFGRPCSAGLGRRSIRLLRIPWPSVAHSATCEPPMFDADVGCHAQAQRGPVSGVPHQNPARKGGPSVWNLAASPKPPPTASGEGAGRHLDSCKLEIRF